MNSLPYWNHNIAYYDWIKRQIKDCSSVLDVGCGNGLLLNYLNTKNLSLTGIDTSDSCIEYCTKSYLSDNIQFFQSDFLTFNTVCKYDAIIFSASIHHMDMVSAINKAKSLLQKGGKLIIVGLAKPSGFFDYLVEVLRIVPVHLISAIRKIKTTEEIGVPVSYTMPTMQYVRKTTKALLPNASLKYGLYYRYLLTWTR